MLSISEMKQIEEDYIEFYYEDLLKQVFSDDIVDGTLSERYDVDKYRERPARCIISKDTIRQWEYESDFVWDYLKSKGVRYIYQLADDADKEDEASFEDFCWSVCYGRKRICK